MANLKIQTRGTSPRSSLTSRLPLKTVRPTQRASVSYLALVTRFPIKPIGSESELDQAIEVIDGLLSRPNPLDEMESGYLESLSHEVERFEAIACPMPIITGAAMLRHLIDAKDVTLTEVAASTRIAVSTISSILAGKRQLNCNHMKKMAGYFGVAPGVFFS